MDSGFLGTGWAFPVRLDDERAVELTGSGEQAVRQSIWTILSTSPGERVMRPDFGCGIHDFVFDVRNSGTANLICRTVNEALALWEPRIDVLDVSALPDTAQPERLLIEITYQVRGSNSRYNLVYPFYLS